MIYVVTVVHNRKELSKGFAEALSKQNRSDIHLILVDDGSTDGTAKDVEALIGTENLTVLRGDGTLYWGGGLQRAYEYLIALPGADRDVVFIANDDVRFQPGFLDEALHLLETAGAGTLLHAAQQSTENPDQISFGHHIRWHDIHFDILPAAASGEPEPNAFDTRALFLFLHDLRQSGGFDPVHFPHYLSDWDFTHGAYQRGMKLLCPPSFSITVETHATNNQNLRYDLDWRRFRAQFTSLRSAHRLQSILHFIRKHAPAEKRTAMIREYKRRYRREHLIYWKGRLRR